MLATWQLVWIQRAIFHFSLEAVEAKASLAEVLKSLELSETKLKSMESDLTQKNSELETLRSQLQNRTTQNAEAACQTASPAAETSRSSPSSKSSAIFEQQVILSFQSSANLETFHTRWRFVNTYISIAWSIFQNTGERLRRGSNKLVLKKTHAS